MHVTCEVWKPIRVIFHLPDLVGAKLTITSSGTLAVNLSIEGPISQLTTAVGGTVPTFKHLHFSIPKSIMAHQMLENCLLIPV